MNALTQRHRAQQLLLRRATQSQVEQLWPVLNWSRLNETYPAFAVAAAGLVELNRSTSAGLASTYLRKFRKAAGVTGDFRVVRAEPLIVEQFSTSLWVTSVVAAKTAAGGGAAEVVAMGNALTQTKGSLARLVLNAGRETVLRTTSADDKASGFQRVLGGKGCDFCQMLAGRGAVYSEDSVEFEAHDHCGCSAEPIYA